jgi:hypothetical protein
VSGIADPFNGHVDEFRIEHVQRSDGWIETTWNNMSDPGAWPVDGSTAAPMVSPLAPAAISMSMGRGPAIHIGDHP